MKKLISVLLAVLMMFSALTVGFMAFAEDAEEPAPEEPTENEQLQAVADAAFKYFLGMTYDEFAALDGDAQWEAIQKMDMNKVLVLAKTAKIVLKLAKVAMKLLNVLDKLNFIDLSPYKKMVVDFIADAIKGINVPGEETPTEPVTP